MKGHQQSAFTLFQSCMKHTNSLFKSAQLISNKAHFTNMQTCNHSQAVSKTVVSFFRFISFSLLFFLFLPYTLNLAQQCTHFPPAPSLLPSSLSLSHSLCLPHPLSPFLVTSLSPSFSFLSPFLCLSPLTFSIFHFFPLPLSLFPPPFYAFLFTFLVCKPFCNFLVFLLHVYVHVYLGKQLIFKLLKKTLQEKYTD